MSNHDQLRLVFLRGGGGSWLSNLIWHLKNQDWTIPTVSINFYHVQELALEFVQTLYFDWQP